MLPLRLYLIRMSVNLGGGDISLSVFLIHARYHSEQKEVPLPLLPHQTKINDRIVNDLLFGETPEAKPAAETIDIDGMLFTLAPLTDPETPRLNARCIRFTQHDFILIVNSPTLDALHNRFQSESVIRSMGELTLRPLFDQWNRAWFVQSSVKDLCCDTNTIDYNDCFFIHSLFTS